MFLMNNDRLEVALVVGPDFTHKRQKEMTINKFPTRKEVKQKKIQVETGCSTQISHTDISNKGYELHTPP